MLHLRDRFRVVVPFALGAALLATACAPSTPAAKPTEAKPAAAVASPFVAAASPSPSPSPSPSANPVTTGSEVIPAPAGAALKITAPAANSSVPAGAVRLAYDLTNVTLVPAAEARRVEDLHVHALLDVDPAAYLGTTTFIPLGNPSIIHSAAKEVTFNDVKSGQHKVAVILTGANHISVRPPVSDSMTFTVQ